MPVPGTLPDRFLAAAPKTARTLDNVKTAMDANKGYGEPQWAEFRLHGIAVFVIWNGPYSGRAGIYSWAYHYALDKKRWLLLDASLHEGPSQNDFLQFVYVDTTSQELHFLGKKGRPIKSLSLRRCWYR